MATQTQNNATADAAAASANAHKDGVERAADKLLDDSDAQGAMSTGTMDKQSRKEYTKTLTDQLVASNLLPSVAVNFLDRNFEETDLDGDNKVDLTEIYKKRDILGTIAPGSLDAKLYAQLAEMMDKFQLPRIMTQEQVREELKKIGDNYLKQDRANAVEVARMLDSRPDLYRLIDNYGQTGSGDGIIHINDLKKFLSNPPAGMDEKTISQLTWLRDNWDGVAVSAMKNSDQNIERSPTRDTLGDFLKLNPEPPPPAKPRAQNTPEFGDVNDSGHLNRGYHDFGRPDTFGHSAYWSDGKGYTVAMDRAKDDPKFDPSSGEDPNKIVSYTIGLDGHYEGWKYDRGRKVWTLYRDGAAQAEADDIRMDIDGQLIRMNMRSLISD